MLADITPDLDPSTLKDAEAYKVLQLLREQKRKRAQGLFFDLYPDEDRIWPGPTLMGGLIEPGQIIHAREKYAKHLEFFQATTYRESCFMAANRVGKTFGGGGYALSCHLTGLYPDWWPGPRFPHPISAWAAGDTYETTRDIVQLTLLGEISYERSNNGAKRKGVDGCGVIPGWLLGRNSWRSGVQDLVDTIQVKHVTGGNSKLGLKSYDQGRRAFQGTGRHVIWFDEEPPMDVYNEALMRTATLHGIVMLTFTPLMGLSEVVLSFMPADQRPDLDI